MTRARLQLIGERAQLQNQVEALLEEGRIKLSSVITDLPGVSGRRIGDCHLQCGREALSDALTGSMSPIHCQLLGQHLDRIELLNRQIEELHILCASHMQAHQEAVVRLIEVPGIGAGAAQEIIAEIGPAAAAFPSAAQLASWIGVCPGSSQSAGQNQSGRCAMGNRFMRRVLCQAAQAAARTKDSHLQSVFKRLVVRLGYTRAIWAIAHRLCRIIWNVLHQGQRFIECHQSQGGATYQPPPQSTAQIGLSHSPAILCRHPGTMISTERC